MIIDKDDTFVIVIMQHRTTGNYQYFTRGSEEEAREHFNKWYSDRYKIASAFRGKDRII